MKYLRYKTYLSMIDKCKNLEIFRNFYIQKENGEIIDVLEDGDDSCATFVSNILYMNNLIKSPHATVDSTEKDLINSGWEEFSNTSEIEKGDIVLWDRYESHPNRHFGIYLGDNKVVHNNYKIRKTDIEDLFYRPIQKMFRNIKKDD